jgi:hypothetical protein
VTVRRSLSGGVALLATALLAAACTSSKPLPEPIEVETCEGLEEVGVQLVEVWVEVVDQIPYDDLVADPPPPEMAELARIGRDLDTRASRLDCDAAQLNAAIRERVLGEGDIDPTTAVGELVLDLVEEGIVGQLPPAPVGTTTTLAS